MNQNAGNSAPKVALTVGEVESVMEVEPGSLRGLPWLLLIEEASGRSREQAAMFLGIGADVVETMLVELTQSAQRAESQEDAIAVANAVWAQGIAALRGAQLVRNQVLETGWDQVEATALVKLQQSLESPGALRDPKDALLVAEKANRALRRRGGESATPGSSTGGAMGGGGLSVQVGIGMQAEHGRATHYGHMVLSLSPRIREQLENAPQKPSESGGLKHMEMLSLESARKLADTTSSSIPTIELEANAKKQFTFGNMNFESVLDQMKESNNGSDNES